MPCEALSAGRLRVRAALSPEEEGYSDAGERSWTLSSSDGLSGQWLLRKIRVAAARAGGRPEGQRPECCLPGALPREARAGCGQLCSSGSPGHRRSRQSLQVQGIVGNSWAPSLWK